MPAVSKKQYNFMKDIASGRRIKAGLTREQASEYIQDQNNYHKLPLRSPTSKAKKMRHGQY